MTAEPQSHRVRRALHWPFDARRRVWTFLVIALLMFWALVIVLVTSNQRIDNRVTGAVNRSDLRACAKYQADIGGYRAQITGVTADIASIQADIASLQADINQYALLVTILGSDTSQRSQEAVAQFRIQQNVKAAQLTAKVATVPRKQAQLAAQGVQLQKTVELAARVHCPIPPVQPDQVPATSPPAVTGK